MDYSTGSARGKKGFVIDSLARTGSTTLARVLSCHPDIECLIEPFHPRRYGGQFRQMALQAKSVEPVLDLIWQRWSGIKHVWQASKGWPFPEDPHLNDGIVLAAGRVIFLERRNLLRRYISSIVSRQLDFWIGSREDFLARLGNVQLGDLNLLMAQQEIRQDQAATQRRLQLFRENKVQVIHLHYEDFLGEGVTKQWQFETIGKILGFLGLEGISESLFEKECARFLDPSTYQWASADVYGMIPGVEEIERVLGSDETGWLF